MNWNAKNNLFPIAVFLLAIVVLAGCAKKEADTQDFDPARLPREKTLYISGFQWGAPSSFNPLAITPAWPITGNINLVYQALFGYDLLSGEIKPIIGKSYSLQDKVLKIELHESARWQDGEPLTSADVVYSYNLHKKYNTNFSFGINNFIEEIKENGTHAVTIYLSEKQYNPLMAYDIISTVQILPHKIFEQLEKEAFDLVAAETGATPENNDVLNTMRLFKNDRNPVGSGPYTLFAYTDDQIILKRIPSYWGNQLYKNKQPAPLFIVHSSFPGNNEVNIALQNGDLDISQTFLPEIWKQFPNGVGTWYEDKPYYIPGIIPALMMGLSRPPIQDVNFRRAIIHAIDYENIRHNAVYGYTPKLKPGLILPFGAEKEFFSEKDAQEFGSLYDPEKSRLILKKAGYSWGSDGMLIDPSGKKIRTLFATCPAGWTDWESTIKIVVEGLRAIGVDVQEKFLSYEQWDRDLKNGMFDFSMKNPHPEQSYSLPWARFDRVMSSKDLRPVGEVMYHNEGRYRNPLADSLLEVIPRLSDPQQLKDAYHAINRLFMDEVPVIPLMYRPWLFYQFNSKYWKNFPTAKNPYASPQCLMVGAGVEALWGIKPQR
jgi:peptide/nickel transport system substrate-binding protein